jgi:hypothetical protein
MSLSLIGKRKKLLIFSLFGYAYWIISPNKCKEEPTEGCECLPGYVLSGTECVPQNQCGCQRDGEYYPVSLSYITTYSNMTSFFCFTNKRAIIRNTNIVFAYFNCTSYIINLGYVDYFQWIYMFKTLTTV